MCCDSDAVRRRNKPGYMRGTPWILEYRDCGNNLEVRTIRREGRSRKRSEPSETARRAPVSDRMMIQSTPHGDMRANVNKVSVGEPADGSPPKNAIRRGGLGKVERASASRSRASNPLLSWSDYTATERTLSTQARRRHPGPCLRPRTSFPGGHDDALAGNFDAAAFPPFPEVLPRPREDLLLDRRVLFLE